MCKTVTQSKTRQTKTNYQEQLKRQKDFLETEICQTFWEDETILWATDSIFIGPHNIFYLGHISGQDNSLP